MLGKRPSGAALGILILAPDAPQTLDRLLGERGKPKTVVSDNGTQLTSHAILRWADDQVSALCISHSSRFGGGRGGVDAVSEGGLGGCSDGVGGSR